jgi:hypothetical protein
MTPLQKLGPPLVFPAMGASNRAFFAPFFDVPLPVTAPPVRNGSPVRMWAPLPARRPVQVPEFS